VESHRINFSTEQTHCQTHKDDNACMLYLDLISSWIKFNPKLFKNLFIINMKNQFTSILLALVAIILNSIQNLMLKQVQHDYLLSYSWFEPRHKKT